MTGEPVKIRLYFNPLPIFIIVFVRLAFGFLIAVDSSIAKNVFDFFNNAAKYDVPLAVDRASTFIIKIRSTPGTFSFNSDSNNSFSFLFGDGLHTQITFSM